MRRETAVGADLSRRPREQAGVLPCGRDASQSSVTLALRQGREAEGRAPFERALEGARLESKADLRLRMAALRDAISPRERLTRSAAIARRLHRWERFERAQVILVFMSFGSEVMTEPIIGLALVEGKVIGAPRTLLRQKRLEFRQVGALGMRFARGPFGIREPSAQAPLIEVAQADLILVPGLAFDRDGYRLGYGGGFYDRVLAEPGLRAATVGLAFEEQIVRRVPHGEGDQAVGWIVTDQRIITCRAGRHPRARRRA